MIKHLYLMESCIEYDKDGRLHVFYEEDVKEKQIERRNDNEMDISK